MQPCNTILPEMSGECEKMESIEKVEIEAWKNSIVIKGRYVKPEVLSKIKEKLIQILLCLLSYLILLINDQEP